MMYRFVSGYSRILRIANGIRRSSPVRTNILSSGSIVPHCVVDNDLKTIPPRIKQLNIKKDGVSMRPIIYILTVF